MVENKVKFIDNTQSIKKAFRKLIASNYQLIFYRSTVQPLVEAAPTSMLSDKMHDQNSISTS